MDAKFLQRVLSTVEANLESRPSQAEFELDYQARTACDRIRFAIKSTEQCAVPSSQVREANLQLFDALDRLESAERHFQDRFRARVLASDGNSFMHNGECCSREASMMFLEYLPKTAGPGREPIEMNGTTHSAEWLSPVQVATELFLQPATLANWRVQGKDPAFTSSAAR